ncbi:MAG TPA: hypothetical protein VK701_05045 [Solirubrobacteraceae bacterium]|jgi:hypothetical protein|nr:hypothetical protein [Solirubrobacteraceae bacterium]
MSEPVGQADLMDSLDTPVVAGSNADEQEDPVTTNLARVRLAEGPLVGPVLWRVLSMMLARADWPLNRLDDALLMCDVLAEHTCTHTSDAGVTFSIEVGKHEAELRVLDLREDGAQGLVQEATLPLVGNVLERIADRVSIERGVDGVGSQLIIVLSARIPCRP